MYLSSFFHFAFCNFLFSSFSITFSILLIFSKNQFSIFLNFTICFSNDSFCWFSVLYYFFSEWLFVFTYCFFFWFYFYLNALLICFHAFLLSWKPVSFLLSIALVAYQIFYVLFLFSSKYFIIFKIIFLKYNDHSVVWYFNFGFIRFKNFKFYYVIIRAHNLYDAHSVEFIETSLQLST